MGVFFNDASQASIGFLRKCRTYFVCGTWVLLLLTRLAQYSQLNVDLIVLFSKARRRAICELMKCHSLFLQKKDTVMWNLTRADQTVSRAVGCRTARSDGEEEVGLMDGAGQVSVSDYNDQA